MTLSLGPALAWATIREFTTLQSDPRDLWPLKHLWQFLMTNFEDNFRWQFLTILTIEKTVLETCDWLQFWQLRTWIHDNLCYLTIKSDTGHYSQYLRCLWCTFDLRLSLHITWNKFSSLIGEFLAFSCFLFVFGNLCSFWLLSLE